MKKLSVCIVGLALENPRCVEMRPPCYSPRICFAPNWSERQYLLSAGPNDPFFAARRVHHEKVRPTGPQNYSPQRKPSRVLALCAINKAPPATQRLRPLRATNPRRVRCGWLCPPKSQSQGAEYSRMARTGSFGYMKSGGVYRRQLSNRSGSFSGYVIEHQSGL